jgi:predicted transcriptional regulator
MEEVWRRSEASVREIREALNARNDRPRAYTTVMTVMVRLDRKGMLSRRRSGRKDVYVPALERAAYHEARARAEVDAVVAEYGEAALAHFARRVARLDPERRDALRRLARGE